MIKISIDQWFCICKNQGIISIRDKQCIPNKFIGFPKNLNIMNIYFQYKLIFILYPSKKVKKIRTKNIFF